MNHDLTRGQLLYLTWPLPFEDEIAEVVHLDLSAIEVTFTHADTLISSFTDRTDADHVKLMHADTWSVVFVASDYDWLPDGESEFEVSVVNSEGTALVLQAQGTVTIHG